VQEFSRRIYGLENEYGIMCTLKGQRRLSPDEVARYLFRKVVTWGRSSNVFLPNGSRLYLDVGSHPEYATAECDSLLDVVAQDRAGEYILNDLRVSAEERLADEGIRGDIHIYKNNTDSAGNSYGCHENYLTSRTDDQARLSEVVIPFLITRQIFSGAGKLLMTAKGPLFTIAQRAEHIWETSSSATTRSRPIINTRDEPHADAEHYRRLHVIVGDSNMSDYATFLKVGSMACVLRMFENPEIDFRDLTLESPVRAIREISHDITCKKKVKLKNGKEMSALDIQRIYLDKAISYSESFGFTEEETRALQMWEHCVSTIESDPLKLETEVDWVAKYHLVSRYSQKHDISLGDPRCHLIDLQYHDIDPTRGIYYHLRNKNIMKSVCSEEQIVTATESAPTTTRAHLRSQFITAAQLKKRDYTVDWVHLKINDQSQRTVLCKNPFKNVDDRVQKLIDSL